MAQRRAGEIATARSALAIGHVAQRRRHIARRSILLVVVILRGRGGLEEERARGQLRGSGVGVFARGARFGLTSRATRGRRISLPALRRGRHGGVVSVGGRSREDFVETVGLLARWRNRGGGTTGRVSRLLSPERVKWSRHAKLQLKRWPVRTRRASPPSGSAAKRCAGSAQSEVWHLASGGRSGGVSYRLGTVPPSVNVGFHTNNRRHVSWNDPVLCPGHPRSRHRGWRPDIRKVLLAASHGAQW